MKKNWHIAKKAPDDFFTMFADEHPVLLQLLWNRGLQTKEEIQAFLDPDWNRDIYDPFLFSNISKGVKRVFEALENGEMITIHGDYDADGVTGAALLFTTLRDICRSFQSNKTKAVFDETCLSVFIPDREKEGYGFSPTTVDHLINHEKTKLIITVDCGISSKKAIKKAKSHVIDTIVCDHHTIPSELPLEAILIHPLLPGENYPNKFLCGCGVAFKFACALLQEARERGGDIKEGHEKWLLDFVAIATVTDVMPLLGENRVLEKYGLFVLQKTRRIGLQKLLEMAGQKGKIDTRTIGFQIGPRLNAPGRINHANLAFGLLIEEDPYQAEILAKRLDDLNKERQDTSDCMYEEAKSQIGKIGDRKLLLAVKEGWKQGLVGLVAGKLTNEYGLPTIVATKHDDHFSGSGRSIEGFHITEALCKASEYIDKFGGHPQACGFSTTGIDRFTKAMEIISIHAQEVLKNREVGSIIFLESELDFTSINWDFYEKLERFEPFGTANVKPVFFTSNVKIIQVDPVGRSNAHVRLLVSQNNSLPWKMIGFRFGDHISSLIPGCIIDVAYEVGINEWNGRKELQLRLVDWVSHL